MEGLGERVAEREEYQPPWDGNVHNEKRILLMLLRFVKSDKVHMDAMVNDFVGILLFSNIWLIKNHPTLSIQVPWIEVFSSSKRGKKDDDSLAHR